MQQILLTLRNDASDIAHSLLRRWEAMHDAEPWWSTDHLDSDHLVELITRTADAALVDGDGEGAAARFIDTAMKHGRDRLSDGHPDTVIHQEFVLLRRALRADLRERLGDAFAVHEAANRLDGALNLAEIASLHGYHERELPEDSAAHAHERLTREWIAVRGGWPAPS